MRLAGRTVLDLGVWGFGLMVFVLAVMDSGGESLCVCVCVSPVRPWGTAEDLNH